MAEENKNSTTRKWSRKHDACIACGSTRYKHFARGLCIACYLKDQYNTKTEYRPRIGWARGWDRCRDCGTTLYPHASNGLCTRCIKSKYNTDRVAQETRKLLQILLTTDENTVSDSTE